uniref:glycosyltransferase n=1 Tax=Hydrogenophaga sp. TaxID=1904254 RepID=UPI003564AF7C
RVYLCTYPKCYERYGPHSMRVLQFGRFWNEQHGGVERHAHLLCKGLAAQGVDVVNLVASRDLRGLDDSVDGFRLVQAPSFGMAFRTSMSPALVASARRLHREQPFDLFHLHFPDPLTHFASLCLPADVPRVITWHSDIVSQKYLLRLYRPALQREARKAAALVAATPAHFETSPLIPPDIPAARRHVIPYGLDYQPLKLTPRTEALRTNLVAQATGRGLIFALGRHVSYKGFDVLIDAMQHTQAVLMLGGDGPLKASLMQQAARLGLSDRVHFCGRIAEQDLGAYFHACDLFCLPSVTAMEAFGLVQLEAMSCGKPVVCTQLCNGVNRVNISGKTGVAVPVGDAVALGKTLDALLKDEILRAEYGANALAHARDPYSVEAMSASHVQLYQQLLLADQGRQRR